MQDQEDEKTNKKKQIFDWVLGILLFGIGCLLFILWGMRGIRS